ncbi:HPr family phosphocarrier protein [Streptomyces sp. YIM S03343]
MEHRAVVVGDPRGLHARTAHRLSSIAAAYSASVWIRYAGRRASLADPLQLLALGVTEGAELTVLADGIDEADALRVVCQALASPS